jgi:hypothetical protein
MGDSTTILFGVPGLRVREVVRVPAGRTVHVVTDDPDAAACPMCGVFSTVIRQRRTTRPRDLTYGSEPLVMRWHKVQFSCAESACPRKAFTESIGQLPPGARVTGRLRRNAGAAVAAGCSVAAAVRSQRISWPIVHAAFVQHAQAGQAPLGPVRVLGIDETRRGRPKWVKDPVSGKWSMSERFETNFVDLAGDGGLLGQTAGRTNTAVIGWLDRLGQDWKDGVQIVATDPCAAHRRGRAGRPSARADRRGSIPRGTPRESAGHRGPPASDPGDRGPPRPGDRSDLGLAPPAATRPGTPVGQHVHPDVERAGRQRPKLRPAASVDREGRTPRPAGHRPPADNATTSPTTSTASTPGAPAPPATSPRCNAWPAPCKPGGPRSSGSWRPGSRTRPPKEPTTSSKTPPASGFRNLENQRRRVRWACTHRQRQATATA